MAFLSRVFSSKGSFVPSFTGCLSWCFRSEPKYEEENGEGNSPSEEDGLTSASELNAKRAPEYTTENHVANGDYPDAKTRPKENGTAYQYDDQDTSSDSDDEVLRRYQQSIATIQRVPSKHSVRSSRSHRSTASKQSKHSKKSSHKDGSVEQDHLISLVEKGGVSGGSGVEGSDRDDVTAKSHTHSHPSTSQHSRNVSHGTRSTISSHSRQTASSQHSGGATGSVKHEPSDVGEEAALVSQGGAAAAAPEEIEVETHTFENQGFSQDQELSPDRTSSEKALSQYAETASMSVGDVEQDEHMFDISDLQDREPALISKCGTIEITFSYDVEKLRMNITVHQAKDIPSKDRGGANNSQVRLLLLPTKKVRHKTKIKPGENPVFDETFNFKVPLEEVNNMGVRCRLYGCERMRRERMIGESVVGFASLNLDQETTHMLTLEPRSNLSHGDSKLDVASLTRSDSASSTQSMQHGGMPELLIGLAYNGTTGRLSVEVIKGSNFRNMAMNRAPDTYVKLTLMSPNGQEIARSKTSIRRGQPNPLYKETFMFQVALFQLPDVTLMVSVYNKRSMKRKEMIGWFSLGLNNSGEEELAHWTDMRESKGEQVCRWHVLLES